MAETDKMSALQAQLANVAPLLLAEDPITRVPPHGNKQQRILPHFSFAAIDHLHHDLAAVPKHARLLTGDQRRWCKLGCRRGFGFGIACWLAQERSAARRRAYTTAVRGNCCCPP